MPYSKEKAFQQSKFANLKRDSINKTLERLAVAFFASALGYVFFHIFMLGFK